MNWLSKRVKRPTLISWPTPETDYEGNDLWALRLTKQPPLSQEMIDMYKGMQNMYPESLGAACIQSHITNAYWRTYQ